ncbi:uncharacterized protein C5orf34 homolog isoform X1 [Stegostoma tigrinum]|uniref:uncharacterized protein C5orf34 homolog isoform X1 n=1 Tax=Stegostoma tigrinum TaxID=3053191 RepID=UPI0028706B4C|nr:uncharacterized protein C5orf34 homolog isoform X1 [Stegostoma tigrinum]XP_048382666.2 uncharacterized protein C5orf34 homolog isoform X1 [Stegostoma tigrinum]
MAAVSLMVLYEDDSVEVQYTDNSCLQLSPCGSEFLFEKAPVPSMHPLQSSCRIRQRTPFVISSYKDRLLQALEFRNQFASRPYLPARLISGDKLSNQFLDICEVKWPEGDEDGGITVADSGWVTVSSLDGRAFLNLAPSRLEFTVEFLTPISKTAATKPFHKLDTSSTSDSQDCHNLEQGKSSGFVMGQNQSGKRAQSCQSKVCEGANPFNLGQSGRGLTEIGSKYMCQYKWMVQHHTVSSCPQEWHCPLRLALHYDCEQEKSSGLDGIDNKQQSVNEPMTPEVSGVAEPATTLPRVLPLNCPAPHLHRWRFRDLLGQGKLDLETCLHSQQVKVVWCKSVLYRVITDPVNSVEVYPGDGSVLKPHSGNSNYFTHYLLGQNNGQREERTYMVSSLPPDTPNSKYSICSMVSQAVRILQRCNLSLKVPSMCCWKTELSQPGGFSQLPSLLEEQDVQNVGRFSAFSNGQVHISFCDGVRLNASWNFGSWHGEEMKTLSQSRKPVLSPVVLNETQTDLMLGWCQLLFPDGSSQLVPMYSAGRYQGYTTAAMDWCRWVSKGNREKASADHPNPQVNAQDENRSIIAELQKIQRFNFLLENSNCLKHVPPSNAKSDLCQPTETTNLCPRARNQNIETVLKNTGQAIQEIEMLLEANKKDGNETKKKHSAVMGEQRDAIGSLPLLQQGLRL